MPETKERLYVIPLRKEWLKVARRKRAKRAVTAIKLFLTKHMKAKDVKISQKLNEKVWFRGVQKPPAKIKVLAEKDEEGIVFARLPEEPKEIKEEKGIIKGLKEKISGKKEERPEEKGKSEEKKSKEKPKIKEEIEKKEKSKTKEVKTNVKNK